MIIAENISFARAKLNILLFSALSFLSYVAFMMLVKYTNLLHVTGLRTINFVFLTVFSLVQIRTLIRKFQHYIPFLEVISITFVTGTLSFFFFSVFLFFYSFFDPQLNSLFIMDIEGMSRLVPCLLAFFEGSGISIIIGLIVMEYADYLHEKRWGWFGARGEAVQWADKGQLVEDPDTGNSPQITDSNGKLATGRERIANPEMRRNSQQ